MYKLVILPVGDAEQLLIYSLIQTFSKKSGFKNLVCCLVSRWWPGCYVKLMCQQKQETRLRLINKSAFK